MDELLNKRAQNNLKNYNDFINMTKELAFINNKNFNEVMNEIKDIPFNKLTIETIKEIFEK